jgi:hypothetical protein
MDQFEVQALAAILGITYIEKLLKSRSGKLLRRVLRAGERGMPIGDPMKMEGYQIDTSVMEDIYTTFLYLW